MSDIFISYAREDRPRIELLAKALADEGLSVWWDRELPFGRPFREVIEEKLLEVRCVIVAWSTASVKSGFVLDEATVGQERGILIPLLLDDVDIPLGFGQLHAADLQEWSGDTDHPRYKELLEHVGDVIEGCTPKTLQEEFDRRSKEAERKYAERRQARMSRSPRPWETQLLIENVLQEGLGFVFKNKPEEYWDPFLDRIAPAVRFLVLAASSSLAFFGALLASGIVSWLLFPIFSTYACTVLIVIMKPAKDLYVSLSYTGSSVLIMLILSRVGVEPFQVGGIESWQSRSGELSYLVWSGLLSPFAALLLSKISFFQREP